MENVPSRDTYSHLKKKRVRETKGIRKPRTPLPNATISCWKLQLQTHSVNLFLTKTCMRKFHGKLFWPVQLWWENAGLGWRLAVVQACTKYQKQAGKSSRTACARALV